ncbi:MAG: hypothetical protein ACPHDO_05660 [Candidatus Poseidoniaceae archaeon]
MTTVSSQEVTLNPKYMDEEMKEDGVVITDYIKYDNESKVKFDNMMGLIGDYGMAKSLVKKSFL